VEGGALERLRDNFALGTEAFRRKIYAIGREKSREISGGKELRLRVAYDDMVKAAEKLTGEKLEEHIRRRGSRIKPLVIWAGRKACGLTLRQIGERLGGMDYNAVSMAMKRWEKGMNSSPALSSLSKRLMLMCSV
jgi:hypothetical protein